MSERNVHQSGEQLTGGGGWSEQDSKNFRAALDLGSEEREVREDAGEAPRTGAFGDIGKALGGPEK
ncbi:hypothetical protein ACFV9C_01980 [Kribbella sp. NPDC059898]|uniref:hypothetical protein n=1 Tax=Kribbella sp. NPDC059898 TaxID=3346995 RepID=UPI00365C98FE